ncbi:MAG: hypothetical protein NTZ90_10375 [Proteobacteria bacterium]|nr:hypothetical protein [Pseudomonadota bacterium]
MRSAKSPAKNKRTFSADPRLLLLALALAATPGCITSGPTAKLGVQEGHASYVPARIALVGCQLWPEGARFAKLPLTNAKPAELQELCAATDGYLLASSKGQSYMKGYSPEIVIKRLEKAGHGELLGTLPQIWSHRASDHADAVNAPAVYRSSIAGRPEWLLWLNSLSTDVRNADAVLLPFITYAYERQYDDSGLQVAERSAGIVVLLIDTNNGALIWAGGRDAVAANKRLSNGNVPGPLNLPPWSDLNDRLFIEELWKEFPGRQVF